jgi:hypothetical protein
MNTISVRLTVSNHRSLHHGLTVEQKAESAYWIRVPKLAVGVVVPGKGGAIKSGSFRHPNLWDLRIGDSR